MVISNTLPPPVRAYLEHAIPAGATPLRSVQLTQTGTFKPALDGRWLPITARQSFLADPLGFVWDGRVSVFPGIWIDAHDRCLGGVGRMRIVAESVITITDALGRELDESAALRLLGELVMIPTAFLDTRHIAWDAVDGTRAQASLTVGRVRVHGAFEFGADRMPCRFTADRFRAVRGRYVATPFIGELGDYREVDGFLLPHSLTGSWVVNGIAVPYARLSVGRLALNAATAM